METGRRKKGEREREENKIPVDAKGAIIIPGREDKIAGFFNPIFGNWFEGPKLRTRYKSDSRSDWEAYRHGRGKRQSDTDQAPQGGEITQDVIDEILDKINRSGYDSLSKEEKEYLFKYGNK